MKQNKKKALLVSISTLFTSLYIVGSLTTVSGLKCYKCAGPCRQGGAGKLTDCPANSVCQTHTKGRDVLRDCVPKVPGEMLTCTQVNDAAPEICLCDTEGCNGVGTSSIQLGHMSFWVYCEISVLIYYLPKLSPIFIF